MEIYTSSINEQSGLIPYQIDSNEDELLTLAKDAWGKKIQLFSTGEFIVGSGLDLAGTVLLANQIPQGVILIVGGGALNFGAMFLFTIGHSLRDNGENRCCPASKEEFIKLMQNCCAYSTGIASITEMIGTLAVLEPAGVKLGRGFLLGAGVLSGVALSSVFGEMVIGWSECMKTCEKGESTDIVIEVSSESSLTPELKTENGSGTNLYKVCKSIRCFGMFIFSAVGFSDPITSNFIDFSPNSTVNSNESDPAKAIFGLSIIGYVGLGLFTLGGIGELYLAPQKTKV
jgi:hypothetical protein